MENKVERFNLTEDQQIGLDKMLAFTESDEKLFLLTGFAGSGKSTLLKRFLDLYMGKVMQTAPTHKSAKVIRDITGDQTARTIHSALALKPKRVKWNEWKLIQTLSRKTDNMQGVEIVVVDEGFMLDTEMLGFIVGDIESSNRKYIIIGDMNQLTPVNEDYSPLMDIEVNHRLTKVVRQTENSPILRAANVLRQCIENGESMDPKRLEYFGNEHGRISKMPRMEFIREIHRQQFLHSDDNIVITWTNDNSQLFNGHISKYFNKREHTSFEVGDDIIFNAVLLENDDILINNGYEDTIVDIRDGIIDKDDIYIEYKKITLENDETPIRILEGEWKDALERKLNQLKKIAIERKGSWHDFYMLQEMFADIRFKYSCTSYKSQGSDYENVFIDGRELLRLESMSGNEAMLRHFYVAITRARKNCYITYG